MRRGWASATGIRTTPGVVPWATWTGDPSYDLYSHARPGTTALYSSAGYWRLAQALTVVWKRDLKDVVQERLFGPMGIPADRWDWLTGGWVKDQRDFYPTIPDSYTYLDPPYEIDGRAGPERPRLGRDLGVRPRPVRASGRDPRLVGRAAAARSAAGCVATAAAIGSGVSGERRHY